MLTIIAGVITIGSLVALCGYTIIDAYKWVYKKDDDHERF